MPARKHVWPGHADPPHSGWKRWCAKCRQLKAAVDRLTGKETPWTAQELRSKPKNPLTPAHDAV